MIAATTHGTSTGGCARSPFVVFGGGDGSSRYRAWSCTPWRTACSEERPASSLGLRRATPCDSRLFLRVLLLVPSSRRPILVVALLPRSGFFSRPSSRRPSAPSGFSSLLRGIPRGARRLRLGHPTRQRASRARATSPSAAFASPSAAFAGPRSGAGQKAALVLLRPSRPRPRPAAWWSARALALGLAGSFTSASAGFSSAHGVRCAPASRVVSLGQRIRRRDGQVDRCPCQTPTSTRGLARATAVAAGCNATVGSRVGAADGAADGGAERAATSPACPCSAFPPSALTHVMLLRFRSGTGPSAGRPGASRNAGRGSAASVPPAETSG